MQDGPTLNTMGSMPCPRFYKPSNEYNNFSSEHSDDATWDPQDQNKEVQVHKLCSYKPTSPRSGAGGVQLGFTIDCSPHFFSYYLCNIELRGVTIGTNLPRSLGVKITNLALTKLIKRASSAHPSRYVDVASMSMITSASAISKHFFKF